MRQRHRDGWGHGHVVLGIANDEAEAVEAVKRIKRRAQWEREEAQAEAKRLAVTLPSLGGWSKRINSGPLRMPIIGCWRLFGFGGQNPARGAVAAVARSWPHPLPSVR